MEGDSVFAPSCGEGRGACGPQQLVCRETLKFDPDGEGKEEGYGKKGKERERRDKDEVRVKEEGERL